MPSFFATDIAMCIKKSVGGGGGILSLAVGALHGWSLAREAKRSLRLHRGRQSARSAAQSCVGKREQSWKKKADQAEEKLTYG